MSEAPKESIKQKRDNSEYALDFTTSSAISQISLKFLILYIPIFWFSGILLLGIFFFGFHFIPGEYFLIILPLILFAMYYVFFFGCIFLTKLFLVFIKLIHNPREGVFKAETGNKDFEFWRLRIELKKIGVWLLNNSPLPWSDAWAFRWFGVKMNFSSHLNDAWCDVEFISFGRQVLVGQGAVVMSSMVVGQYLIIKRVILDDYVVIGGQSTVAPGTIIGKDTVLGPASCTSFKQLLESGWIYFGIPGIKLKPNKYAESQREIISKKLADEEQKFEVVHDINIDEKLKNNIPREE